MVAPAAPEGELPQELLVENHVRDRHEGPAVRGGAAQAVRDTLPRVETVAVLQGLRLQLGRRGPAGVCERRRTPPLVGSPRWDGLAAAPLLCANQEEEDGARPREEEVETDEVVGPPLEDQNH